MIFVSVSRLMLGTNLKEEACCGVVEVDANDLGPVALVASVSFGCRKLLK